MDELERTGRELARLARQTAEIGHPIGFHNCLSLQQAADAWDAALKAATKSPKPPLLTDANGRASLLINKGYVVGMTDLDHAFDILCGRISGMRQWFGHRGSEGRYAMHDAFLNLLSSVIGRNKGKMIEVLTKSHCNEYDISQTLSELKLAATYNEEQVALVQDNNRRVVKESGDSLLVPSDGKMPATD